MRRRQLSPPYLHLLLLVMACVLQVALTSAPHHHHHHEAEVASSPEEDGSCRQPNYQYEYKGQGEGKGISCNFSVTWRGGGGEPVSIVVTALVPEQREGAWASLSLSRNDEEAVLVCQTAASPPANCALSEESEAGHGGCEGANLTYHASLLECSFAPPRTESWQALLSAPVSLQLRSGNYTGTEDVVCEASSKCQCDLNRCQDECSCAESSKCHTTLSLLLIRSHAILMVVTFLILLPTAVMIARYTRPTFPYTWFKAHVVVNVTGTVFLVLGFAAVLGHAGGTFTAGFHQVVGIICVSLTLFQPLCGFLRPAAGPTLRRRVFNIVHRSVGTAILGLGSLAMFLGVLLYRNSVFPMTLVVLVIAVIVEATFVVAMEIIMRREYMPSPPVGYQRVHLGMVGGRGEEGEGEEEEERDSGSDRELFGEGGDGLKEPPNATKMNGLSKHEEPLRLPSTNKRVLAAFVVTSFLFSVLIATLISYGDH